MVGDLAVWAARVDWLQAVVTMHYFALVAALCGVVIGDVLGARILLLRGPPVSPRAVRRAHALVLVGLVCLLLSGSALLVTKHDFSSLPSKLTFKLGLAALVCVNSLFLQHYLLPLAAYGRRPMAANLGVSFTLRTAAIGTTSLICWVGITTVSFIPALQVLSAGTLYQGAALCWLALFSILATTMLMAGAVYRSQIPRYPFPKREAQRSRSSDPQPAGPRSSNGTGSSADTFSFSFANPTPAPQRNLQEPHQAGPMRLSDRLADLTGRPPVNDNPQEPIGAAVQLNTHISKRRSETAQRSAEQANERPNSNGPSPNDENETHALKDVQKSCRNVLTGVAIISLFTNLLMLTGPLFMLQVYDRVLASKSVPTLTALFVLTIALFAFMGLLEAIRSRLLVRVGLRIDRLLASQVFDEAINIGDPTKRHERMQLVKDLRNVRQFASGPCATAFFDMPWAPLYFALLFVFHWTLGALALCGAVILVTLSVLNEWLSRRPVTEAARYANDCERIFEAGRRGNETLQSMGMGRVYRNKWLATHCDEILTQTRASDISGTLSVLTKTTRLILQSAVLAAGAYLVLQNLVSPGVMIASSILMSRALAPIETTIANWRSFIATRQGYSRLSQAFSEAPVRPERLPLSKPLGFVSAETIFASPVGMKDPVLKGVNFELKPGDALGVLGASGSGKSTLARVLVGVWPTLRGHVRLDGAALHHWPPEQLGRHIGYLPQAVELFDGTVADNIARFDPEATPQDIIAAARLANVHDMIQALPEGYNTKVGDGGMTLSGGHQQRVGLARALFRQPAFVVLDEPNSNLDADGEAALSQSINTLRQAGSTVVVLAHRRKALEHVNLLLVLKDGRQVAFGAKDEILKSKTPSSPAKARKNGAGASGATRKPLHAAS